MSGKPAYIGPPAGADIPAQPTNQGEDTALQNELTTTVRDYLTAWATSNSAALDRYVTRDATPAALGGLRGTVKLQQVQSIYAPAATEESPNTRTIVARVYWDGGSSGLLDQAYRIDIVRSSDNRWYVKDIRGAMIEEDARVQDPSAIPTETGG